MTKKKASQQGSRVSLEDTVQIFMLCLWLRIRIFTKFLLEIPRKVFMSVVAVVFTIFTILDNLNTSASVIQNTQGGGTDIVRHLLSAWWFTPTVLVLLVVYALF